MNIQDYFGGYKINKYCHYPLNLSAGTAHLISELYDQCIRQHILKKEDIILWHRMLMDYIDREDAIFWVRYFESGNKKNGRWNNRRACLTRFNDGFSYVFVSNYDVHEIFNMVRLGVKPDVEEFTELMNTFKYRMHYDKGNSCEESSINAYPLIGTPRGGILTPSHWYLSHIIGIKSEFVRSDGSYKKISRVEASHIFPRGVVSDWDITSIPRIRNIKYSLSQDEKKLVIAHFLRFVAPLNYYVTPGTSYGRCNLINTRKNIGELDALNKFMSAVFDEVYGSDIMDEFRAKALIPKNTDCDSPDEKINFVFSSEKIAQ